MATQIHTEARNGADLRNPRGIYKGNREEYLEEAMHIMAPFINETVEEVYETLNPKGAFKHFKKMQKRSFMKQFGLDTEEVKISCSLMNGMYQTPVAAHCNYKQFSGTGFHEVRIGAHLGGRLKKSESTMMVGILLHELVHVLTAPQGEWNTPTFKPGHGHEGLFPVFGKALGLKGKPTQMCAYPETELWDRLNRDVVSVLGRYPHKSVSLYQRGKDAEGRPAPGSRLLKVTCDSDDCGMILRASALWSNQLEFKICPVCDAGMMEVEWK